MKALAALPILAVITYAIPACADTTADAMAAASAADARHDYNGEFKLLLPLAEQGGLIAEGQIAGMFELGLGVQKDEAEAARWWRKAAVQGDPLAQGALGMMYAMGRGVAKDEGEALLWERKAADQGNSVAQNYLGYAYSNGWGVPKDFVQAYMWFNLAAGGNVGPAETRDKSARLRDDLEHQMTPEQIAEAQKRSAAWAPSPPVK